tara:strand:+ start:2811 stop:2966 length:156 start_codon:yes stop_codon:yes gene_type:complete
MLDNAPAYGTLPKGAKFWFAIQFPPYFKLNEPFTVYCRSPANAKTMMIEKI